MTTSTTRTSRTARTLATTAAVAALVLAACSTPDDGGAPAVADDAPSGPALELTDAWVKSADEGMTAAFGTLANTGGADVTVVAVTSPAATAMELHETVEKDGVMVMQEVESFDVPAGGSVELEPGGNHLMFMGLTAPIAPGDEIELVLELTDGSTVELLAPAKDFAGANESYEGGTDMDHGDMGDMDHGDMDHGDTGADH
ncbi:hypothetical protein C8046_09235 [Serinibacter arcticus]|uniref:Copper metallochaperone n=1 Tax=Serinibacter arcticus TaxID=1655435 RepID=A0A2U1ZV24_9MICO|nr:copper chaperone PCu(A)C [Serinibacter arcticus]PWD50803.1 hypothetical protein C8046_09235 [Serinibacter arcticus]